jgi:hypothetical protein
MMMKEQITKRKMFAKPMSKASKNSGIMAGFEDMEPEEDEMPPMARNPQNPEILMNNLRGDFRSVDARYAELAQMVGEEAASETPPEVLAMLQQQFAAPAAPPQPPQGGIGALPQGAGMAPPPEMMGSMAPPMPQGMEGMPPFPQGGADNAPPTPDGLPPLRAADGVYATQEARRARDPFSIDMNRLFELQSGNVPVEQMTPDDQEALRTYNMAMGFAGGSIRDVGRPVANFLSREAGYAGQYLKNKFGPTLAKVDQSLGNFLPSSMRASVMKGLDGKPIVLQAKESLRPGPGNSIVGQGEGNKLVKAYTAEASNPPLSQVIAEQAARNPRATNAILGGGALTLGGLGINDYLNSVNRSNFMTPGPNQAERDARVNEIPMPNNAPPAPPGDVNAQARSQAANNFTPIPDNSPIFREDTTTAPAPGKKDTNAFIADQLKKAEGPTKTRAERITEEFRAIEPTFRELLGDTKSDMRTNALLLLADAGFKFASERKPTMAMALASALSGMPKGLAVLTAQARDMNIKIKSAALEQAANNINMQDKLGRDLQVEMLKSQNRRAEEILKSDLKIREIGVEGRTPIEEDAGVGGISVKNKRGDYLGFYLKRDKDGKLPSEIQTVIDSPYTLRPTSPYVTDLGEARTPPVTDKATRLKIREELMGYDDALASITQMKNTYANSASKYGPKGWYSNVENNLLVPILPIDPNIADEKAFTTINSGINQLQSRLARLGGYGSQVAVQEQKWIRELLPDRAGSLFADVEVNLAKINALETMLLNERQQRVNRLTGLSREYVMTTPAMGTQKDPFIMPGDPEGQASMESFLRSTIGTVQDPRATIYVRLPNGTVQATTSAGLRGQ